MNKQTNKQTVMNERFTFPNWLMLLGSDNIWGLGVTGVIQLIHDYTHVFLQYRIIKYNAKFKKPLQNASFPTGICSTWILAIL